MTSPFVLAVPSKGRLQENAEAFFTRAGMTLAKPGGARAQHNRRMRVATKYINLTRSFFAAHGIVDYRIVESAGATEGAPAVGTAEMIVDITTTGATLAANGLKVLDDGVILKSQANLVASKDADWSNEARETARVILDHIAARARASKYREVRTRFAGCNDA